jgi:hypothetical protein
MLRPLYVNYVEIFKLHFVVNFSISNIIILVKIITVTSWFTNPHVSLEHLVHVACFWHVDTV